MKKLCLNFQEHKSCLQSADINLNLSWMLAELDDCLLETFSLQYDIGGLS